ncbi:MAG: helix-turn-helix domain-containing protein [Pseudomonadota bacterium]
MGTKSPVLRGQDVDAKCSGCQVGHFCLAAGSDSETLEQLDELLVVDECIESGAHVARRGDAFRGVLAVRRGCFKSYRIDREGREQVRRFHFPGELIGLDAVSRGIYQDSTVALQDSATCAIDYQQLLNLSQCAKGLQQQLFRLFSGQLAEAQLHAGEFTAEERIAAFVCNISERLAARGHDAEQFELAMSRNDIGNHLGLATETVSRVFSRLRSAGVLNVRRKHITILDRLALFQLAEAVTDH